MSLDVIDRHSEALFEFLWCPVCGHEVFSHIPSRACSASTATHRWNSKNRKRTVATRKLSSPASIPTRPGISTSTKKLRRDLPDGSARVKILGAPGDYEIDWWSPEPSEDWEPVKHGEFDDIDEPDEVSHLA